MNVCFAMGNLSKTLEWLLWKLGKQTFHRRVWFVCFLGNSERKLTGRRLVSHTKTYSVVQSRPFDLLVFPVWSIFSRGPKRLTFYSQVLWATEHTFRTNYCFRAENTPFVNSGCEFVSLRTDSSFRGRFVVSAKTFVSKPLFWSRQLFVSKHFFFPRRPRVRLRLRHSAWLRHLSESAAATATGAACARYAVCIYMHCPCMIHVQL